MCAARDPLNSDAVTVWYAVRIEDRQLCSGASFSRLVSHATSFVPATAVRVTELEIVPSVPVEMQPVNDVPPILPIETLYNAIGTIVQLVWGRFFFFRDEIAVSLAAREIAAKQESLLDDIALSDFTICAFDNTEFVLFTRSLQFASALLSQDCPIEITKGTLASILHRQGEL